MKLHNLLFLAIFLAIILAGSQACSPNSAYGAISTITTTTDTNAVIPLLAEVTPYPQDISIPASNASVSVCIHEGCIYPESFWLNRPISSTQNSHTAPGYRFGSSQYGTRDVHHGVEFINPTGTPVLAAADGVVVFAGSDNEEMIGSCLGFYGNVIILEHVDPAEIPFYSLYGHLSQIEVRAGQLVTAGTIIGMVGATGTADGSHLHFEVRARFNEYGYAVNPELYLLPFISEDGNIANGVLAIRVINRSGEWISPGLSVAPVIDNIVFLSEARYPEPYGAGILHVQGFGENYLVPEITQGTYRIAFIYYNQLIERFVEVQSGSLTFIEIQVE